MQYILSLYWRLIAIKIRSQLQYRAAFIMEVLSTLLVNGVGFLSIALVLQKFEGIAGWSLWEIAFLYGIVESAFGLMDMLFSGFDPQHFGLQVRSGSLDQMLLRPTSVTLQVLGSEFVIRRIGRILQGTIILGLAIQRLPVDWTLAKISYLPLVLISQVAFFGGLFIIGATITFWTVESIEFINIFTYGGTEMIAYPMSIYQDWMRKFFTFIVPAIFLNYYPSLFFLEKIDPLAYPSYAPFLAPVAGFGLLIAALLFWNFGLQHYQSTGT